MIDPATQRLGKKEPKHDPRTVKLSQILPADLPEPRDMADWLSPAKRIGMLNNDRIGCCGLTSLAHLVQCWTAANGREVVIPDAEVERAYTLVGDYVPGRPETDNGVFLLDAMNWWRREGFTDADGRVHKIDAFALVDLRDQRRYKQAIDYFGGVIGGYRLPLSARGRRDWSIRMGGVDGSPERGSWGGHAVCTPYYRDDGSPYDGLRPISWGAPLPTSWAFHDSHCDEAFVAVSRDWADIDGSPRGHVFQALLEAVGRIA